MLDAHITRLEASGPRMEHSARFELAWSESLAGFADRCLQPLGHECDCGAPEGTRTPNRRFWRPPFYQLSYRYAELGHYIPRTVSDS